MYIFKCSRCIGLKEQLLEEGQLLLQMALGICETCNIECLWIHGAYIFNKILT